ncbi:hypothetical protein RCL1_003802 [Eukaryota sp. TZLM3-RCL]
MFFSAPPHNRIWYNHGAISTPSEFSSKVKLPYYIKSISVFSSKPLSAPLPDPPSSISISTKLSHLLVPAFINTFIKSSLVHISSPSSSPIDNVSLCTLNSTLYISLPREEAFSVGLQVRHNKAFPTDSNYMSELDFSSIKLDSNNYVNIMNSLDKLFPINLNISHEYSVELQLPSLIKSFTIEKSCWESSTLRVKVPVFDFENIDDFYFLEYLGLLQSSCSVLTTELSIFDSNFDFEYDFSMSNLFEYNLSNSNEIFTAKFGESLLQHLINYCLSQEEEFNIFLLINGLENCPKLYSYENHDGRKTGCYLILRKTKKELRFHIWNCN